MLYTGVFSSILDGPSPKSLNTWRVFLGAEVLYGVMTNAARRMMVEEFFHCYHPSEIIQLRGMYCFMLRNSLLRLVSDTPNSNTN